MFKPILAVALVFTVAPIFPAGAMPAAQELRGAFKSGAPSAVAPVTEAPRKQKKTRSGRALPGPSPQLAALIAHYAKVNGVPAELAHRVIIRESRYNPNARNRVYWGLMQISHATARGMGYRGPAQGLLDPETNLRFGMTYLGNAYRIAGGDQSRAVRLYASGFYHAAKRQRMLGQLRRPADPPQIATR